MERFNRNVGAMNPALQETPEIFKGVRVNRSLHIRHRMIDDFVGVLTFQAVVGLQLIAVQSRARFNALLNLILKCFLSSIFDYNSLDFASALKESHDHRFAFAASARNPAPPLSDVHIAGLAADESLIDFDFAREFLEERAGLHGLANPMQHEPRRLLSDSKVTSNFIRTDSVLAVRDDPDCHEPLVQAERGILEDAPNLDAELPMVMHTLALPFALISKKPRIGAPASRADYAARPSPSHKVIQATVCVAEIDNRFLQRLWLSHVLIYHDKKSKPLSLICQVYSSPR